jgi:GNAT superfamily N-acetyltransferase
MRHLEELAANAWPGLRGALVDGWVVRFARGYSRRANSVLPLYGGVMHLESRIARCEDLFRSEGIAATFKLFPGAEPGSLDAELEQRGYARQASTSMMILEHLTRSGPELPKGMEWSLSEVLTEPWFQVYAADHAAQGRDLEAARAIMEHIVPGHRFCLLKGEDGPVACAMVVLEDGWAGVFDVVVRKDLRGKGLGRLIMERTLAEAAAAGARRSYLQVMDENRPAVSLYQSMGFRLAYPYWYRVQEVHL